MMKKNQLYALLSLILLWGCGGKKEASASNPYGLSTKNNVVWWLLSDIEKITPYISSDANASYARQLIWEPLNFQHPVTLELLPGLADTAQISEDHLTYTYKMNPSVHWSDGRPLTGEDVIFSFKVAMNPKLVNSQQLRNYLQDIDSVYYPGGDRTQVAFRMSKTYYDVHTIIAGGYVLIVPKHILDSKNLTDKMSWADLHNPMTTNPAVKELAEFYENPDIARDPKYMVGSGPYMFKEWKTNQYVKIARDPKYWADKIPLQHAYPEEIIFKTINDQNAALTALKGKDIDIMETLKPEQWLNQVDTNKLPYLKKDTIYYNAYTYIGWNNAKPLFADKRVRKALTMLINRAEMQATIYKNLVKPLEGPVVPGQPDWDPTVKQAPYDPAGAKQLLAEAGWSDSDGDGVLDKMINGKRTPFEFTFSVNAGNEVRKQILLVIAESFRKAGINAGVQSIEWAVYLQNLKTHQYDAFFGSWLGNASEDDIYQLWHSTQAKNKGSNYVSFVNAEADQLLADKRTEFDKTKRFAMSRRFQQIVADDQPVSFLFMSPLLFARVDRFDNVVFFRQRPCFDVRYWIVRGADIKRIDAASF